MTKSVTITNNLHQRSGKSIHREPIKNRKRNNYSHIKSKVNCHQGSMANRNSVTSQIRKIEVLDTSNSQSTQGAAHPRHSNLDMPKQMSSPSKPKSFKKKKGAKTASAPYMQQARKPSAPVKRVPPTLSANFNRDQWGKQSSGYKSPCDSVKSGSSSKFGFSTL